MVEDTGRSQKAYSEEEDQTSGGSGYSDWLSSQIIACGKAMGLSVRDDKNGWENLIRFAQGHIDANNAARVVDRSKKKATRELQNLKTSVNYDVKAEGGERKVQASQRFKGKGKVCQ